MCDICKHNAHIYMFKDIVSLVFRLYHLADDNYFWFFFVCFWLGFFGEGVCGFLS